jgi:hypothetical protein
MRWHLLLPMLGSGLLTGLALCKADTEAEATAADEQVLKEANVAVDGPGLLEFFRKRTLNDEQRKQIKAFIDKLDSRQFAERQEASSKLEGFGPPPRPVRRAPPTGNIQV